MNNEIDPLIVDLCDNAQRILDERGTLCPIAMVIKENGDLMPCPLTFRDDREKVAMYYALGNTMKKYDCYRIIFISDVAVRMIEGTPEEMEKIRELIRKNVATEQPLTYPESMRQDGIYLQFIDLKKDRSDAYFKRYENRKSAPRLYHELKHINKDVVNIDGSIFTYIKKGYNESGNEIDCPLNGYSLFPGFGG